MAGEDKTSTVRALVRGTRSALIVQLVVAALALAATVFALWQTRELEKRRAGLQAEVVALESAGDGLRAANEAASAGYRQWQRWLARADREALEKAGEAFGRALENAPGNAIFQDQLAQIRMASGDAGGASEAAGVALEYAKAEANEDGEESGVALSYYARLAAYQCAAGQAEQARTTLAGAGDAIAALQANAELNAELVRYCGGLGQPAQPGAVSTREVSSPPSSAELAEAYKVKIVYLHIRDEADRADAERLRAALRERGYRVPGIQLVAPPRGYRESLRYYYDQQSVEAAAMAGQVTAIANEIGLSGWAGWTPRTLSLAGAYENLPRDRVEIWLPERSPQ